MLLCLYLLALSRPIYTLLLVLDQLCPSKSIPTQLGKKIKIKGQKERKRRRERGRQRGKPGPEPRNGL